MSKTQDRTEVPPNSKLERRLAAYAMAAGTAGAGVLGLAPAAKAEVIYTPVHANALAHWIDLDNDGNYDFRLLRGSTYCSLGECRVDLSVVGMGTGSAQGEVQVGKLGPYEAAARQAGGPIGPQKSFKNGGHMAWGATTQYGKSYVGGSWANVKRRYLGLRFKIGSEIHYGWARLNVHFRGFIPHAVLTGYAYETEPNKPIAAGDEGAGGSLGNLALGAAGRH